MAAVIFRPDVVVVVSTFVCGSSVSVPPPHAIEERPTARASRASRGRVWRSMGRSNACRVPEPRSAGGPEIPGLRGPGAAYAELCQMDEAGAAIRVATG